MAVFTTEQLDKKESGSFTTAELDQMESVRGINLDPEIAAKRYTASVFSEDLGIDENTANATYNGIVKNIYGKPLKPTEVQKRMQEMGRIHDPVSADSDMMAFAQAAITNTDPPQELVEKKQRQDLVKQTVDLFTGIRRMEDALFEADTEWSRSIRAKPDTPEELVSGPEWTDADLLDISAYMALLESTNTKQQVDEIKRARKSLISELYFSAVRSQQESIIAKGMRGFTTGSKARDVTLEAARGLYTALQTIQRGAWSTSVAMGMEWNQPAVDDVTASLKSVNLTPLEAAGKMGFVSRAVSEAIPSFAYNMTIGKYGIFITEYGNAYQDVIDEGNSEAQANAVAIPVATINTIIESMQIDRIFKFAGGGKGAKQAVKKMIKDRAYKAFLKSGAKFTGQSIKIAINEGIEGALQEGVSITIPGLITGVYPKNEDGSIDWVTVGTRVGQSFVGEGLGGLFLGVGGGIYNARNTHNYKLSIASQLMITENMKENDALSVATAMIDRLKAQDGTPKEIYREELGKVKMADNRHKASAHIIQKAKGIGDEQYRRIADETTGKQSIKDMNYEEAETFITALQEADAEKVEKVEGVEVVPDPTEAEFRAEVDAIRDAPEPPVAAPVVEEPTEVQIPPVEAKPSIAEQRRAEVERRLRAGQEVSPRLREEFADLVAEVEKPAVEAKREGRAERLARVEKKGLEIDARLKKAGDTVDGRVVRKEVPNAESIEATFGTDFTELPGIREIPMADFEAPPEITERTKALAEEIEESGEINPLIVAFDNQGPYILEGGHRFDALKILGAESFPAVVVTDNRSLRKAPTQPPPEAKAPKDIKGNEIDPQRPRGLKGGFADNAPMGDEKILENKVNELSDLIEKPKAPPKEEPIQKKKTLKSLKRVQKAEAVKVAAKGAVRGIDRAFGMMSTRIKNISLKLFQDIRNKVINPTRIMVAERTKAVHPFVDGVNKKLNDSDRYDFEVAQWQADEITVKRIIAKSNLTQEYEDYRTTLDEIYHEANAVGMNVNYQTAYFPSAVKDFDGLLKELNRREQYAPIVRAMEEAQKKKGRPLSRDEQLQLVSTLLRGFRISGLTLTKPGFAKERTLIRDDVSLLKYYHGFEESTSRYIESMTENVQERKFFGKTTKELVDLRANISRTRTRLAKLEQGKTKVKNQQASIDKAKARLSELQKELVIKDDGLLENSIANHALDLIESGAINFDQQLELKQILEGLFKTTTSNKWVHTLRSLEYAGSLAQIPAIITQYSEVVLSILAAPGSVLPAFVRANLGKSEIKLKDIGVAHIGQEWVDADLDKTVTALMKPFELADRVGKEAFVNSVINKYRKMAKVNPDKLKVKLAKYYPDTAFDSVIASLLGGTVDNNVKGLALNELGDVQPISKFEVPELYAKAGNLRVFYMYKTFVLKRLDILRNKGYNEIKAGVKANDLGRIAKGLAKLVWLAFMFSLADATADVLKDIIRGRPLDTLDNYIVDNLLQMILLNKYVAQKSRREGPSVFFKDNITLPISNLDAAFRDVLTLMDEDSEKGSELVKRIPWLGELYYWYMGEGARKIDEGVYDEE